MKFKYYIPSLLLAAFALGSCSDDEVAIVPPVQYIQLSKTNITLGITETIQLTAKVTPENAADTTGVWESSNPANVTVDENGLVTGVAEGDHKYMDTIFAIRNNVKAICLVDVVPVQVSDITLDITEKITAPGSTLQLTATVLPAHATDKSLTWSSSDEAIATVDQNGLVTLGSEYGSAKITVTSSNGKTAICEVVALGDEPVILPSQMELDKDATRDVRILLPEAMKNETVAWSSKDVTVATVEVSAESSKNATVKAVAVGQTQIVATVAGKEYTCNVVRIPDAFEMLNETTVIMNLSKFENSDAVTAKIKELDGQNVTEYRLFGDFQKLSMGGPNNAFAETKVVKIDFTGIDPTTWSNVVMSSGEDPVAGVKGLPKQAFNCKKDQNFFPALETVILPADVKGIGFNAFQYLKTLKTLVAPGAYYLGDILFNDIKLTTLKLTAKEEFVSNNDPKAGTLGGFKAKQGPCVLYIHPDKAIPDDKNFFGKPFFDILHE